MTETPSIPLRDLLGDLDPCQVKTHFAVHDGESHPLDVMVRSWEEWTNWNSWRSGRNDFSRPFIFSMAVSHDRSDRWIFGGVFEVLERYSGVTKGIGYHVALRDDLLGRYIGRLVIDCRIEGRTRRRNFESDLERMAVAEILAERYSGEPFPGHDKIDHSLGELEIIWQQHRQDWRFALQHMKGVYIIRDRCTGKGYVGSACGEQMLYARWSSYVATGHGHNRELRALIKREGRDYAREHLHFSLLDYWSKPVDDQVVLNRESYWKRVLMTQAPYGLNAN